MLDIEIKYIRDFICLLWSSPWIYVYPTLLPKGLTFPGMQQVKQTSNSQAPTTPNQKFSQAGVTQFSWVSLTYTCY